jgi:hypothetical protein
VALVASCGLRPTTRDSNDGGASVGAGVKAALGAPAGSLLLEALTASRGAQGIWLASAATSAPTLTGVLTQGPVGWTYAAGGSVLELRFTTGAVNQFTFTTFQGDTSGTAQHYLDAPHVLAWRFVDPLKTDLTCSETRTATGTSGAIQGTWIDDAAVKWTVDLTWTGTNAGTVTQTSADTTRTLQLSGTATGDQGTVVTVDETVTDHLASSTSTLVETLDRAARDGWTDGAGAWSLQDFETKKTLTNGAPSDEASWLAKGSVLLDGGVAGTVSLVRGAASLDVVLSMNGQTTVLESTSPQ